MIRPNLQKPIRSFYQPSPLSITSSSKRHRIPTQEAELRQARPRGGSPSRADVVLTVFDSRMYISAT
ncbi:hypothetical protein EVAR_100383_1 [Eumeta japonica]|uniref:Uncharacterized protein n=1 Tax=Eumeta variegata TaxID=151549 RepID=A0A4C1ZQW9_EUMVA|nr:hypothetical protein EVAR_100383_1 [Eumeta japonica]